MEKNVLKRWLAVVLAVVLALPAITPRAFAADAGNHWSASSISRWSGYGIIEGDGDRFDADRSLTRAQVATILTRLLHLTEEADISGFTDVPADAWYATYIARCVQAGILNGVGDGLMSPTTEVTRAQMFTMVGRALGLPETDSTASAFNDSASVPAYAAGYFNTLINLNVVNGVGGNLLAPNNDIAYSSAATVLDRLIGTYVNENGTYSISDTGITLVVAEDVTLTGSATSWPIVVAVDNAEMDMSGVSGAANITVKGDNLVAVGVPAGTIFEIGHSEGTTVNGVDMSDDSNQYVVPSDDSGSGSGSGNGSSSGSGSSSASSDTGITGITVGNIVASVDEDGKWTAELPVGSELPGVDDIIVEVADENAACKVEGPDENGNYTITVTAEDGKTTAEYTLTVTVAEESTPEPELSDNTGITGITVDGILAEVDEDGNWSVELPKGSELPGVDDIIVKVADENAAYKVEGPDENGNYTITVTAEDGETTAEYTLTITVSEAEEPKEPDAPTLNDYGLTGEIEDGVILHTWSWSFNTIKAMIPQIAAAGFSAIQTSPISHVVEVDNPTDLAAWYYVYQPTEYKIGNIYLGTEEEFKAMCDAAHEYGVKVIVDAVINHTTSDLSKVSDNIKKADWGDAGQFGDSENPWRHATSFSWYDGTWGWYEQNRLTGTLGYQTNLIDLNTHNEKVQQYILSYLESCVAAGADGFRFDAMRSIELPTDKPVSDYPNINFSSDYLKVVIQNGASFQYGESLQGNPPGFDEWRPNYDDSTNSNLAGYQALTFTTEDGTEKHLNTTLSFYGQLLRNSVSTGNLDASVIEDMMVPADADADLTVTWVESHDNYCNDGSYATLDEQQVIQAWAILAAREKGTPLFFSRPNNATVSNYLGDNVLGAAGSPFWMDPQVVAVNFFRNEMDGLGEKLSNPNDNTQVIMIERGDKGAVIVNLTDGDFSLDGVATGLANGTYDENVYGGAFTVSGGKITEGTVKAGRVAVVYNSNVDSTLELEPSVSLAPASGEFLAGGSLELSETLNVFPSLINVDHATYKIGNDGVETPVQDGDVIVVGGDMKYGDTVTVTLIGYNAANEEVARAEASYTKKEFTGSSVRLSDTVVQNRGWSNPYVYAWGADGDAFGGWPGLALELQADGFWYAQVPDNYALSSWNIIFNINSDQFDGGKLGAGEHKVYNVAGQWVDYGESMRDPSIKPSVSANPGSKKFDTDSLDVTLSINNCRTAQYQLGDGDPTNYENGDTITIQGLTDGKSITLKLFGYNNSATLSATAEYTYTKVDHVPETIIYVAQGYLDSKSWTEVAAHIYNGSAETTKWPGIVGVKQTEGEWEGYWKCVVPADPFEDLTNLTVILNNNGNGSQATVGTIDWGDTKVMTAEGKWINADDLTGDTENPGTGSEEPTDETVVYIAQGYLDSKGWEQVYVKAFVSGSASYDSTEFQTDGLWKGYWKYTLSSDFSGSNNIKIYVNSSTSTSGEEKAGNISWGQIMVLTADKQWIDGTDGPPEVEEPEAYELKIGWFSNTVSGLTTDNVADFAAKLEEYLKNSYEVVIETVSFSSTSNIPSGMDILIGVAGNIGTSVTCLETADNIYIDGATSRSIAWLTDSDVAKAAFEWIKKTYAETSEP